MFLPNLLYSILLSSQGLAMQHVLAPYPQPGPQGIPRSLLTTLKLFSEYSAAATCEANFNSSGGTNVVCDPGVCPMLEQTNAIVLLGFTEHHPGNTTGFVAIDNTNKLIVLAFRGSRTPGNIETDGHYKQVSIDGVCTGCQVHSGFYSAWLGFSGYILPYLQYYAAIYPSYSIVFTGHSLGGALATLGATLNGLSKPVWLYTFGCPELGNYNFAEYITLTAHEMSYRVTHTNDPIPKILSTSHIVNDIWQYSTTSPEFWITSGNGKPVTIHDINVIYGIDNKSGNLGTKTSNLKAHDWYIGNTTGCQAI